MTPIDYIEVYKRRAHHLGVTPQEKAFNSGILEFRRFLKYDEHTQNTGLLRENGSPFVGNILTKKQDENQVWVELLTKLDDKLELGEMITWNGDHWLVYEKIVSGYQPHNKYYITRCETEIKWVDLEGKLHSAFTHLIGSMDSKIKNNYRTWHALITPQANKFMQVIGQRAACESMQKTAEVLTGDESWHMVDYDKISVPGVMFLSFTEDKVNELRDDTKQGIANIDQITQWNLEAPLSIDVRQNEPFTPIFSATKDGAEDGAAAIKYELGPNLIQQADDTFVASAVGETYIIIIYETKTAKQIINVSTETIPTPYGLILGDDAIRTTREAQYEFKAGGTVASPIKFTLTDVDGLAAISSQIGTTCVIKANSKNKLGTITLNAYYNGKSYSKQIKIISLWQVN